MGDAIWAMLVMGIFVPLEWAMIRSARSTKAFTDPMMKRGILPVIAERNMTARLIVGTLGACVGAVFAGTILAMIVCAVLGIPF